MGYAGSAVWELIFEWCAEMFGVTVASKLGQLVFFCLSLFVVGLVLSMRWGLAGFGVPVLVVLFSALAARQVAAARNDVWRAACSSLDDETRTSPRLLAPTAGSLARLAEAVHAVRRGHYVAAADLLPRIERRLLRPEEGQLLDAVRAMISVGLGSTQRAAQQAVAALPTGSEDLDTCLGRTVVSEAWNDPTRLTAIQTAWDRAGVRRGPLSRLSTLVRIRLDADQLDTVPGPEARDLSDEARAIGDDALAAELDARSRPAAYR
jgi:hypothetical protein